MGSKKKRKKVFVGLSDHEPEKEGWVYAAQQSKNKKAMTKTITLRPKGLHLDPVDEASESLLQHCINDDYISIVAGSLLHKKLVAVAEAHGWKVKVVE